MLKDDLSRIAASAIDPAEAAGARWQAIAAQLRADILAGRFAPGERLPNEKTLADRFGVHRHTLRQAVQALVREGHLDVRQGSGTFARELVLDYALNRRTRMTENLARIGETAARELLSQAIVPAGTWAEALKVGGRSKVAQIETRSSVRGRPVALSTAAFPCPRFAAIAEHVADHGSITRAFRALGVTDYTRLRSVISTRLPTHAEADALARPTTQPVLVVQYVNVDREGVPVEAATTLFAADAVQLVVEPDET